MERRVVKRKRLLSQWVVRLAERFGIAIRLGPDPKACKIVLPWKHNPNTMGSGYKDERIVWLSDDPSITLWERDFIAAHEIAHIVLDQLPVRRSARSEEQWCNAMAAGWVWQHGGSISERMLRNIKAYMTKRAKIR